jgi:uncharacterized protein
MPNPVVHFEIIGRDPEATSEFYRKAFDWTIPEQPGAGANGVTTYFYVLPDGKQPPEKGINGGFGSPPDDYDGHVTFYVGVADVAEALKKIESLGGTTMMEARQAPDGPVVGMFQDPQGNTIGLVEIGDYAK